MAGENEQGFGGSLESDSGDVVERDVQLLEQASEGKGEEAEGLIIPKELADDNVDAEGLDEGKDENLSDSGEESEEGQEDKEDKAGEEEFEVANRPTYNAISRKFPEFFKEFPEIKEMMGREQEYAKRFPTVELADEALDKSNEFDQIADHLADGNVRGLLDTVASVSDDALSAVVDKFLPSLMQKDQNLYLKAITPSLANFVAQFFKHGVEKNDKNIQNAALIASEWIFDTEDYATGKKKYSNPQEAERDPERIKLNKEREKFLNTKLADLQSSVVQVAETKLYAKIDEGLKGLHGLNDFTKNTIREKIYNEIGQRLQADKTHMKLMTGIWGRARREQYDAPVWKPRLVTAYLARALALVPSVRAKVVGQALESRKAAVNQGRDKQRQQPIRVTSRSDGSSSQQQNQRVTNRLPSDPKMIDRSKTSDLQILEGKITLKGQK